MFDNDPSPDRFHHAILTYHSPQSVQSPVTAGSDLFLVTAEQSRPDLPGSHVTI